MPVDVPGLITDLAITLAAAGLVNKAMGTGKASSKPMEHTTEQIYEELPHKNQIDRIREDIDSRLPKAKALLMKCGRS